MLPELQPTCSHGGANLVVAEQQESHSLEFFAPITTQVFVKSRPLLQRLDL